MEVTLRLEMSKEYQKDDGKIKCQPWQLPTQLPDDCPSDMKQVVAPIIII